MDCAVSENGKFRWLYNKADSESVDYIARWGNLQHPIAEVLVKRGITTKAGLDSFLKMPLKSILNPFGLKDMDKCVSRLALALKNHEKICIYGDYDADGVTATAVLYIFLKKINADVFYYIPNRLNEGYGLNIDAVHEIVSKGANLLVTVDCGISAKDEVAAAVSYGIDVIVTDHHEPADAIPDRACAVIDPLQNGDTYPFKGLSGVGVAFKVVMALRYCLRKRGFFGSSNPPNIKDFLDIVALGTVADVMPIVEENRIFVYHGLAMMSSSGVRVGLSELKNVAGIQSGNVRTSKIGFVLAPRINAVGRMGSSDKSLRLLLTNDRAEARELAAYLNDENKCRQDIERDIVAEIFDKIEKDDLASKHRGLVLSSKNWHSGVIGIAAARVVDRYFRPTIILTEDGDFYKGSARSIPAFHLYNGLKEVSDLLAAFGGHKYAAGLKIAKDKIPELQKRFDEVVRKTLSDDDFTPEITIDAFLDPDDIDMDFACAITRLEPFGTGNKEPVFALLGVYKKSREIFLKDNAILKCYFEKHGKTFECIGYNMSDYSDIISDRCAFDIAFTIQINEWNGSKTVQLCLKDIRKSGKHI